MSERAGATFEVAELFAAMPPESNRLVRELVDAAPSLDLTVHLVGGPVRDHILGREVRDLDLLVVPLGDPPSVAGDRAAATGRQKEDSAAARLARATVGDGGRVHEHGRFGTVSVERAGAHVDLATARTEQYRRPGALPDVERGSLDEDLARRDFSVNAMSIELTSPGGGATTHVHDPYDGLDDLAEARLRVLHARSFHDDPTRALRAARLAGRLGFGLTRATRSALRDALRDGAFGGVSGERFRRELQRVFSDARLGLDPARALRLLADWHVLPALEPGLDLAKPAVAPLRRLGRFTRAPEWRAGSTPPWHAGVALWLAPLPAALRRRTLARFSIRGEVADRIAGFPRVRDKLEADLGRAHGRGAVDELLSPLPEDTLEALHAGCGVAERKRIVRWAAEDRPRRSPIGGADLVELGLVGPEVGRVLARVRAAHLDGEVANREEALALATELARHRRSPKPRRAKARRKKAAGARKPKAAKKKAGVKAKAKARTKRAAKAARPKATSKSEPKAKPPDEAPMTAPRSSPPGRDGPR